LNDEPILARTTGLEPVLPRRQRGVFPFDYVPQGWSRRRVTRGWSARGDSNPDLHVLSVPRLPIAPRAAMVTMDGFEPPLDRFSTCCLCRLGYMATGPSGWTRTTTARVKSPACCVDTTEGAPPRGIEPHASVVTMARWSEWPDSNRSSSGWRPEVLPLDDTRSGSAYGYRTRPPTLATWDASSTTRPNTDRRRSPAHRHPSVVKDPALSSLVGARDSNPIAPEGRTGLQPAGGPSAPYRPSGDSARSRTRTHELWRLGCSRYTTLPTSPHVSTVAKTQPPFGLTRYLCRAQTKTKKAFQGIALEGLFSMSADPLGRFALLPAIERAAVPVDPRFGHGYRHADDRSWRGQIRWPRHRRALRIEDSSRHLSLSTSM
jgi:hypothetical protein